jgi:hypothetical protein
VFLEYFLPGSGLRIGVRFAKDEILEDSEVLDLPLDGRKREDFASQGGDFLDGCLRAFLVIPEIRGAHGRLEFG